jgi:hypothetical protein
MLSRSLVVVAVSLLAASAHASGDRVRLAEVHAVDAKHEPMLRSATLDELGKLDLRRVPANKEAILSVALVRMDTETSGASRSVSCVVSATLRGKKSGNLVAIIEGRARVESRGAGVESSAIAAAVHGAVGRVPEALK